MHLAVQLYNKLLHTNKKQMWTDKPKDAHKSIKTQWDRKYNSHKKLNIDLKFDILSFFF